MKSRKRMDVSDVDDDLCANVCCNVVDDTGLRQTRNFVGTEVSLTLRT